MADIEINDLTLKGTPESTDEVEIQETGGGTSLKATLGNIIAALIPAYDPLDSYPVGAVYTSVVSTSPATLFGGTWSAIAAGKVLVGLDSGDADFDTVEETGGAKTHTLTETEMPSHVHNADHDHTASASGGSHNHTASSNETGNHNHTIPVQDVYDASSPSSGTYDNAYSSGDVTGYDGTHSHTITVNTDTSHAHTITVNTKTFNTGSAGSDGAHNNVQPYFVVYMWKRTA